VKPLLAQGFGTKAQPGPKGGAFESQFSKRKRQAVTELLRALAGGKVECAFVIRSMAGFVKCEEMATKVSLYGMSGYQPPIVEFAALLENVGPAMTRIAEMTAGKAFTTVEWK
jgi:hypothetical protein